MDKTEMYNKIINAIDVLSRVEGEEVFFSLRRGGVIETCEYAYKIGSIEVSEFITLGSLQVRVKGVDVSTYLEEDHLKSIYKLVEKMRGTQVEKFKEVEKERATSYLNSFVGK